MATDPRAGLRGLSRRLKERDLYGTLFGAYRRAAQALPGGWSLPPLHLALAPTMNCNLSCAFCYTRFNATAPADWVVDAARSVPTARIVSLTGGEVFCHPEAVAIIDRLSRERLVTLETNGTLIDDATARVLAGLGPRVAGLHGLYFISVSVHGPEEIHDRLTGRAGAFARSREAAAALVAHRARAGRRFPRVMIRTTITADNAGRLGDSRDLAAAVGADGVIYKIEDPARFTIDGVTQPFRHAPEPVRCPAGVADAITSELTEIHARAAAGEGPRAMTLPASMPPSEIGRYYRGDLDLRDYSCDSLWSWLTAIRVGDRVWAAACNEFIAEVGAGEPVRAVWNSPDLRRFRRGILRDGLRPGCMGCCFLRYRGPRRGQ